MDVSSWFPSTMLHRPSRWPSVNTGEEDGLATQAACTLWEREETLWQRFHFLLEMADAVNSPPLASHVSCIGQTDRRLAEWYKTAFTEWMLQFVITSVEFFRWRNEKEISFQAECRRGLAANLSTLYLTTSINLTLIRQLNHSQNVRRPKQ